MDMFRKILPRKLTRDQYSFELLKSSSVYNFSGRSRSGERLPRYYSNCDNLTLPNLVNSSTSPCKQNSEDATPFIDKNNEMRTTSALVGFIANEENYVEPECSYGFPTVDHLYEKAIAECLIIKDSNTFLEGILLKCIDKKPMFPYLHYSHFQSYNHHERIKQMKEAIDDCHTSSGSLFGIYDEVYSIQKLATTGEKRLPAQRHAGYIVIGFKLLEDANKPQNLEKTWLSWSGAREIYKHSPRNWNLRRIALLKYSSSCRNSSNPFVYILMCEFGSILHPSNTIQALDMCERLRVRNCGHISLYQVHTAYSTPIHSFSCERSSDDNIIPKRHPMVRAFSQDVESPSPSTESRRSNPRIREGSSQYLEDHYYSYHY